MFDTESFNSPCFNETVVPKDHKRPEERAWETRLLGNVVGFIQREVDQLVIKSLQDVSLRLQNTNAIKSNPILLHLPIIKRAKEFMKSQCCVYLSSVSMSNADSRQAMGNLRCSIVYGRSVNDEQEIESWKQGGFDISVLLPFVGQVRNPLYCPKVVKYLLWWAERIPFWSRGIIDVIENAKDMNIEDSNQFAEAIMRTTKHVEGAHNHKSEPADYILFRSKECRNAIKQFALEYQALNGRILGLESRREARTAKKRGREMSEAELTQEAEEKRSEQWSRKGSHVELESNLREELKSLFTENCENGSRKSWHDYALSCVDTEGERDAFMSYGTLKEF